MPSCPYHDPITERHPDQCQGPESVAGGVSGLTGGFLGARPALELRLKFRVSGSLLQQPVGSFRRLVPALGLLLAAECPKVGPCSCGRTGMSHLSVAQL